MSRWLLYSLEHGYIGMYESEELARKACGLDSRRGRGGAQRRFISYGIMPVEGLKEALQISDRMRRKRQR